MRKLMVGMAALVIVAAGVAARQDKSARPSPPASAECKFADGKSVKIDYSSPRAKGRKIMGELVLYGKVWRLGANEATSLVTTAALQIGTTVMYGGTIKNGVLPSPKDLEKSGAVNLGPPALAVPAGSYTLFAVPEQTKWTLIVSKKTGEWGIPYPGEAQDLGRVEMAVISPISPVENFTIAFDKVEPKACMLRIEWETTRVAQAIHEK